MAKRKKRDPGGVEDFKEAAGYARMHAAAAQEDAATEAFKTKDPHADPVGFLGAAVDVMEAADAHREAIIDGTFAHDGKRALLMSLPRDVAVSASVAPARLQSMWLDKLAKLGLVSFTTVEKQHLVRLTPAGLAEVMRRAGQLFTLALGAPRVRLGAWVQPTARRTTPGRPSPRADGAPP